MKAVLLQWMIFGLGLLLLVFAAPVLAEQNATAAPIPAGVSTTPSPSTKNNATATTISPKPIQILQTQAKSTNSSELVKELEKPTSKGNATIENVAKGRKVKITATPTIRPASTSKTPAPAVPSSPSSSVNSNTKTKDAQDQLIAEGLSSSVIANSTNSAKSQNATAFPTPTTSTTTTTTTSTTTPQPKKPNVVYSMDIHPEWEKDQDHHLPLAANVSASSPPSSTLPEPEPPMVQPSQELSDNLADRGGNEYIVPIVTVLLTVPLAIGVTIVMYRRFREMWSTRHYRRMDFLVDGMYND